MEVSVYGTELQIGNLAADWTCGREVGNIVLIQTHRNTDKMLTSIDVTIVNLRGA